MPKRDYSKGQIYTIRCRDNPTLIYVGSTINTLPKRLGAHKRMSKIQSERLVYKTITGNWDRFYMKLYELYPCGSKNELERREGEITREIGTMNSEIAGRTRKEYYYDNREKKKAYYQRNAEALNEKARLSRQRNVEDLKEKALLRRQRNAEALKDKARQRYHKKKAEAQAQ